MLIVKQAAQPRTAYLDLLRPLVGLEFTDVAGAFAYGTYPGARMLLDALDAAVPGITSRETRQRWLLGIDWCRSEPEAFDTLTLASGGRVRVPDGSATVARQGCVPTKPWHPKALLLWGPSCIAVVIGSGNMSRNGLSRGHEAGVLTVVSEPATGDETAIDDSCRALASWFNGQWRRATPYAAIADEYRQRVRTQQQLAFPINDEDTTPGDLPRGWTADRLRQLRGATRLWIDAGKLHANRGPGMPGNQLMLSRLTRVFFGFPADDLRPDTLIGHVDVEYAGRMIERRSLRFSNNHMDVLTLPIPGGPGPAAYDGAHLLFTRLPPGRHRSRFRLEVGTAREYQKWKRLSLNQDTTFTMQGGRGWGLLP